MKLSTITITFLFALCCFCDELTLDAWKVVTDDKEYSCPVPPEDKTYELIIQPCSKSVSVEIKKGSTSTQMSYTKFNSFSVKSDDSLSIKRPESFRDESYQLLCTQVDDSNEKIFDYGLDVNFSIDPYGSPLTATLLNPIEGYEYKLYITNVPPTQTGCMTPCGVANGYDTDNEANDFPENNVLELKVRRKKASYVSIIGTKKNTKGYDQYHIYQANPLVVNSASRTVLKAFILFAAIGLCVLL